MTPRRIFVGAGSNMGNRRRNISMALDILKREQVKIVRRSSFYETSPVGPIQRNFLNAVFECRSPLPPSDFLDVLMAVERRLGRIRRTRRGPRTLDLDILFFGRAKMRSPHLTLPHPRALKRKFVLWPLREIAPNFRPPGSRSSVSRLAQKLTDPTQKVKLYR